MADELRRAGKYYAFNGGIRTNIRRIDLVTSSEAVIATESLAGTEFVTQLLGQQGDSTLELQDTINFTIESGDVGSTAVAVLLYDNESTPNVIARIDLNESILLDTEGTVSFTNGTISATFPSV